MLLTDVLVGMLSPKQYSSLGLGVIHVNESYVFLAKVSNNHIQLHYVCSCMLFVNIDIVSATLIGRTDPPWYESTYRIVSSVH